MKVPPRAKFCVLLCLAAGPAYGQAASPDAVGASLAEILSLATLGTVSTKDQAAQVTQSGSDYLVRLPLKGFSTPPDAAINAVARPSDGGTWDIASMTFPSAGTFDTAVPNAGPGRVAYSIGEQAMHLRIDPNFVQKSSFAATFGTIKMNVDQGGQHSEQSFDRYVADGTLSSDAPGQLSFASRGTATNWHLAAHAPNGMATEGLVRTLSGHFAVEGLDRAQGTKLMTAARAVMATAKTKPPGQPSNLSTDQRQDLRALVDAIPGLLSRFSAEETLDDIRFSAEGKNSGTIGRVHVDMAGDASQERLNARMDLAVDKLNATGLPVETAAFVPHQFTMKTVLAAVQTAPLIALLRAATEPDADTGALMARFITLLSDPAARLSIETLAFDTGPMKVEGSARVVPRANGQLGGEIHISATGMDALMAQAQGNPSMQQVMPMMFMAKGMGRPDGAALVWDISMGDGPLTVNGVPFGQPAPHNR